MSVEQFVAVMGAITATIVALAGVWRQSRQTHELVNSRMTELLELTRRSSRAEGELSERELHR